MDQPPEQVKLREPVFTFQKLTEEDYPDWFRANKEGIARGFCIFPDIRFGRMMAMSMLKEAWNREVFLEENRGATEMDRMFSIAYIQYLASHSGLLSYNEIKKIQDGIVVKNVIAPTHKTFEEVSLEAKARKSLGQRIGLLSGSFDPFTITHASLQLMARNYCDYLILGFDNDEHIIPLP